MQNKDGYPDMYLPQVSILQEVVRVHNINICKVFEAKYVKGKGCYQDHMRSIQNKRTTKNVYFVFQKR